MYPITLLNDPPPPTYPEYGDLLAAARLNAPAFVDPANLYPCREVVARRGDDWVTAVLGFPFHDLRQLTETTDQLLIEADRAGIDPPLPDWIVQGRAESARRTAEREAARQAASAREAERWAEIFGLAGPGVVLAAHAASRTRVRAAVDQYLYHAVPAAAVFSGTRKVRTHRAGHPLCETERRASPILIAASPSQRPVTCRRCLHWVPQVRAARTVDAAAGEVTR